MLWQRVKALSCFGQTMLERELWGKENQSNKDDVIFIFPG